MYLTEDYANCQVVVEFWEMKMMIDNDFYYQVTEQLHWLQSCIYTCDWKVTEK
jgi:hypothetical protein